MFHSKLKVCMYVVNKHVVYTNCYSIKFNSAVATALKILFCELEVVSSWQSVYLQNLVCDLY